MRIEMVNPQEQLLRELKLKCSQRSIATTYAFIMRQEPKTADWPRLNQAIMKRWKGKTALERVKKMAWEHLKPEAPHA